MKEEYEFPIYDVIIIGAGIAGIGAAMKLNKTTEKWLLLQAQDQIGGRIQSIMIDQTKVDIGAYQIAIAPDSNKNDPILSSLKQFNIQLNYQMSFSKIQYFDETGQQYSSKDLEIVEEIVDKMFVVAREKSKECKNLKISFNEAVKEFLGPFLAANSNKLEPKMRRLLELHITMIEQEQSSNFDELSFLAAGFEGEDENPLDRCPMPEKTFSSMVKQFWNTLPSSKTFLNTNVQKVTHDKGIVKVEGKSTKSKECFCYSSKAVICTIPLSLLKKNAIIFQPNLPKKHQQSIAGLSFGVMDKVILSFQKPFWREDMLRMKIASSEKGKFPHFINLSTEKAHILCCFLTDHYVRKLHSKYSEKQIVENCIDFLKQVFPNKQILLKEWYVTNWQENPYSLGSFTFMSHKCDLETVPTLRKPVQNWLWFAGEHCYWENMGCAHGAYATGHYAAKQIIEKHSLAEDNQKQML